MYWKIKNKFRDIWWDLRKRTQRFMRGYANSDAYGFFEWFVQMGEPMLRHLQEHHCGFPVNYSSDEEWTRRIGEMAEHLHYMDEWNVIDELYGGDYTRMKEINETIEEHKTKFFKMFSEDFYNLWD